MNGRTENRDNTKTIIEPYYGGKTDFKGENES